MARSPKLDEDEEVKEFVHRRLRDDGLWTFLRIDKIPRDRLIVVDGEDDVTQKALQRC